MDANHCFQFFNIVLSISVSLPGHHLLPSTWSSWNSLYRTSWLLTPSAGIKVCASMPSFHLSFLKWDAKAVCAHISLTPQLIGPELKRTDSSTHSLVSSPLLSFPCFSFLPLHPSPHRTLLAETKGWAIGIRVQLMAVNWENCKLHEILWASQATHLLKTQMCAVCFGNTWFKCLCNK